MKYDQNGKHLKAIEKGRIPPRGGVGLVVSQEEGYDLKSKVLGKGGDRRFHAKFTDEVLHFPGFATEHQFTIAMTQLALQNHPVWRDLTEILESLDGDALVREHLEECGYKICGYWDEQDEFYEEVILPKGVAVELVGSSVGVNNHERFLKLKFILRASARSQDSAPQKVGELLLVYNENLEFIDENWYLEIESPLLRVTKS